jgi:hypothetical protein
MFGTFSLKFRNIWRGRQRENNSQNDLVQDQKPDLLFQGVSMLEIPSMMILNQIVLAVVLSLPPSPNISELQTEGPKHQN